MNYSKFKKRAGEIESKFGGFRGLPLENLDMRVLAPNHLLNFGSHLLNFGSGSTSYADLCEKETRLDPDESVNPDYCDIDDIPEEIYFDAVIANQVFEHIEKDAIMKITSSISKRMKKGAKIIVTLPNICNWIKYIGDIDHKTPLSFYQMGSFLELSGIHVIDSYRYTKRPEEILYATKEEKFLLEVLKKYFEIDPANFVAVVGEKI